MAQQAAAQPVVVIVNGLADLLPDSYSGDDTSVDLEEFFARHRQWLGIHNNRFANSAEQVAAIKYVLSGTALQWFNDIPAANMPASVNNLQRDLFAKFRIAKTSRMEKGTGEMQIHTRYKYITYDQQVSTLLWETPMASTCTDRKVCTHLANATTPIRCIQGSRNFSISDKICQNPSRTH